MERQAVGLHQAIPDQKGGHIEEGKHVENEKAKGLRILRR